MFVGHAAVALAAKSRAPRASLGVLFAAAFGLDLLWPVLVLLGVETVRIDPGNTRFTPLAFDAYPWSHSLAAAAVWAALAAALVAWRGADRGTAAIVGLAVASHWVLDAISHRPDLPVWPGPSPRVGLGLWNSVAATFAVEGLLLAAGLALYLRATRAVDRTGSIALLSLVGLMVAIWAAGPFSPPPPSAAAVAWVGLATWLLPIWAGWADRHREAVERG